jgi:hypothetical protein
MNSNWLSRIAARNFKRRRPSLARRDRHCIRPQDLRGLEDRVLLSPTPYTVINTSNDPTVTGSLPWAINQANNQGNSGYAPANADGSVIGFDIPTTDSGYNAGTNSWTITLASTLDLSESDGPEAINGPTTGGVIVSGNDAVEVVWLTGGTASISGLTITGGHATGSAGGGILNSGQLTVSDSTISGNSATADGGGIFNDGALMVSDSTISGNSAQDDGAGIFNVGTLQVSDSTISGNSAQQTGGGIADFGNSATMTIVSSTIANNSVVTGGGGLSMQSSTVILYDTIVAGNVRGSSTPDDVDGSVTSTSTANLIGVGTGLSGITNGNQGNQVGTTASPIDPLLAALGNYGGTTQTMALLPGSRAIGTGDGNADTTDQRGIAPPLGTAYDIGAFESQGFTITLSSGSGQSTSVDTNFTAPLVATVTANDVGVPVAGGVVTFTASSVGAGAILTGNPATVSSAGTASVTATANGTIGAYTVAATAPGVTGTASFALTNLVGTPIVIVNPVHLTYGTALANSQLSGTATLGTGGSSVNVHGSFTYTTAAATVLGAGNGQTESVTFTPTDLTDYNTVTTTVIVNVAQASPAVSVNAVNLTYGVALANSQLSGTATWTVGGKPVTVSGMFTYGAAVGTILSAGNHILSVTFTPTDTKDYASVSTTVSVNVEQPQSTPTATPLVVIGEQAVFQRKMKKGKPVGKPILVGYMIDFGTALNASAASNKSNYQVATMTTKKIKGKISQIPKPITNFIVSYLAANDAVEITLGGKQTFPTGGQISLLEGLTSASGGKLEGTTMFNISRKGTTISPA